MIYVFAATALSMLLAYFFGTKGEGNQIRWAVTLIMGGLTTCFGGVVGILAGYWAMLIGHGDLNENFLYAFCCGPLVSAAGVLLECKANDAKHRRENGIPPRKGAVARLTERYKLRMVC